MSNVKICSANVTHNSTRNSSQMQNSSFVAKTKVFKMKCFFWSPLFPLYSLILALQNVN